MAGLKEMALGIATALRTGIAPNPLPVELWGHAPDNAARLVNLVIDECVDAGIALREIRADPVIVHELTGSKSESGVVHRDVRRLLLCQPLTDTQSRLTRPRSHARHTHRARHRSCGTGA